MNFSLVSMIGFCLLAFLGSNARAEISILNRAMVIVDSPDPVPITREIIYPTAQTVNLKVTCAFSQLGQGSDVTAEVLASAEVTPTVIRHLESRFNRAYSPDGKHFCNAIIKRSENKWFVLDDVQILVGEELWQFKK